LGASGWKRPGDYADGRRFFERAEQAEDKEEEKKIFAQRRRDTKTKTERIRRLRRWPPIFFERVALLRSDELRRVNRPCYERA